jgi:putative Holliday junction resolvase
MGKILGIDYGRKRTGIALSDTEKKYAFMQETVLNQKKDLFNIIKSYCDNEEIEKIIIGLPITMGGEEADACQEVKGFVKKLKSKLNIEIEFQDERLTSKMTQSLFKEKSVKLTKQKTDRTAARIILQDYLDKMNFKKDGKIS